jgi:branched-chain amino acid transport system permease protein
VKTPRRVAVLVLAACALALPFFLWDFRTYQLAFAATNAIAILGLNLIAGQAGLISLGHGAFYGLGAYTLAVLMRHLSVSAYAAILAAGLVGLVTGYVFGRVVARLVGFYLALTTFALALALPQMLKSSYVSPWTGGAQGLYLDRPGAPLRLPVTPDQWWYFVTLGMLALLLWMTHNLIAGRIGRAIRAMRDDPIAALVMGIDVTRYTALTFGVGRRTRPSPARSPRSFSISSHPRASPTGSRSSFWWARCSAA